MTALMLSNVLEILVQIDVSDRIICFDIAKTMR